MVGTVISIHHVTPCALPQEALDLGPQSKGRERRWRAPLYWLEMLEIEMVARAVKRIICGLARANPAIKTAPGLCQT